MKHAPTMDAAWVERFVRDEYWRLASERRRRRQERRVLSWMEHDLEREDHRCQRIRRGD